MSKTASLPVTLLSLGFLSLAIFAAGCGTGSSSGTGGAGGKASAGAGGGKGGSAAGGSSGGSSGGAAGGSNGGAAGGKAGAAGGSAGATGGASGGAAGGASGGVAGASAGGAGGGAAGGAGGSSGVAALMAMCLTAPFGASGTGMYSTADFCTLYELVCGATTTHITTCAESYDAAMSLPSGDQRHCRSYHLCNAASTAAGVHCQHAIGLMNVCN
jgi:hypothetical protein